MTPIEAGQQLLAIQAASYPHLKPEGQRKTRKELLKMADVDMEQDSKKPEVTMRELGLILAGKNG